MALLPALTLSAQDSITKPELHLAVDARVDFTEKWVDGDVDHEASGFKGRYLNVMFNGRFNDQFSFSLRHRLSKTIEKGNLWDATDWLWLDYAPCKEASFNIGKQVVAIGGYEYDRAPIDIYWGSEFWNNIACYQFGVSGTWHIAPTDALMFQFCQSPFQVSGMRDIYGYNLQWSGHHGPWQTLWSLNLLEYQRGRYISYISLGNKLTFGDFSAEIDLMNRASSRGTYFFKDCSVMADLGYKATPWLRPFVKYTYDVNKDCEADLLVRPGTEINTIGGGLEAWPLKKGKNEIRVHADVGYEWGKNGNPAGALRDKGLFVNVGVKWRIDIL